MENDGIDEMGYIGESRIAWSSIEGAPKPLPSSRDVAERIFLALEIPAYTDGHLRLVCERIDAYVAVRVVEARLFQHSEDRTCGHCYDYGRGHTLEQCPTVIELESTLSAARERLEKCGN